MEIPLGMEIANGEILTTDEVAEWVRTPAATLRYWRHNGTGPRSFRLGPRRVMYRRADVTAWLEEQYASGDPAA